MKRLFFAVTFCLAAIGASFTSKASPISPMAIEGASYVDAAAAKALFDDGALFVDVRSDADWDAGRIPGAEHLELRSAFDEASLVDLAAKDEAIVIYCNGEKCLRSSEACAMAVEWGFSRVHYFRDGYPAWQSAGLPVE